MGLGRKQGNQGHGVNSALKSNQTHTQTLWQHMRRIIAHTARRDAGNAAGHTHSSMQNTHRTAVCLCWSFTALTQLQFAVRLDLPGPHREMSTHFTLHFSIALLAAEALGLFPQLEFRSQTERLLDGLPAATRHI